MCSFLSKFRLLGIFILSLFDYFNLTKNSKNVFIYEVKIKIYV